jgi:hypothetical protein
MSTSQNHDAPQKPWLAIGGFVLALGLVAFVATSYIAGYGYHLRGFARTLPNLAKAMANSSTVAGTNQGDYRSIIFLHHSVGHNLIEQGSVRELFTQAGYRFWDHDYNYPGLTDPTGKPLDFSYSVPADNTDPDGLLGIFAQPALGLPLNTLSGLMQHEVIAFKSCFPASDITSDSQLEDRKHLYREIRDTMGRYPERLFIVITQPPLNPAETRPDIAARARIFANWLKSDDFLKGHPNIVTLDLFDLLAEGDPDSPEFNMLRQDYREGADSHPTRIANETIGPQFVDLVIKAIEEYRQNRIQE